MKILISLLIVFTSVLTYGEKTDFCDAISSYIERQERFFVKEYNRSVIRDDRRRMRSSSELIEAHRNKMKGLGEVIESIDHSLSVQEQLGCLESRTQD